MESNAVDGSDSIESNTIDDHRPNVEINTRKPDPFNKLPNSLTNPRFNPQPSWKVGPWSNVSSQIHRLYENTH